MRRRGAVLTAVVLGVSLAYGCATSPGPKDLYDPVRVLISYEDGSGMVISKKTLEYGEDGTDRGKQVALPAKIWTYPTAKLPLQFKLGSRSVYGLLEIKKATQFTSVGAVRMELTREHVDKALSGQVIEVTVRDPQGASTVATLLLGDSPMGWR